MLINDENGKFYLSQINGAGGIAFLFEGDKDFIKRSFNFASNYGATKSKLFHLFGSMFYILTTHKKLASALKQCFRNELQVSNGKYSYIYDKEDDKILIESSLLNESEIELEAEKQTQEFLNNKVIKQKFTIYNN